MRSLTAGILALAAVCCAPTKVVVVTGVAPGAAPPTLACLKGAVDSLGYTSSGAYPLITSGRRDVEAWIIDTVPGGSNDVAIDYVTAKLVEESDGSTSVTVAGRTYLHRAPPLWTPFGTCYGCYSDSDFYEGLAASERVTRDAHVVAERCSPPKKR